MSDPDQDAPFLRSLGWAALHAICLSALLFLWAVIMAAIVIALGYGDLPWWIRTLVMVGALIVFIYFDGLPWKRKRYCWWWRH